MKTTEICEDDLRRQLVREHRALNGIDFVEISDDQRTLQVYFLGKAPADLKLKNIVITGGRRITGIEVTHIDLCRMADKPPPLPATPWDYSVPSSTSLS